MAKGLIAALDLGPREHVAVVGGGGKTTLCFALARELSGAGKKVITTTTTKVWHSEANRSPCVVFCHSGPAFCVSVKEGLRRAGHVFVAQRPLESGKVEGISPSMANSLFQDLQLDYLIAEADGAEGRPLKAPAAHEPVIPSSATVMIAMMGIEAIGRPLGPEIVFRAELFRKIAGLGDGEILNPALLARAFQAPTGSFKGAPDSARRIAFLNKLDLVPDGQDARTLAGLLLRGPHAPAERVVIGSLLQNIYFTIH